MTSLEKCMCKECGVQAKSDCAQKRFKITPEMIENEEMPDPKEFPGLYCATSTTICNDLDYDKMCNCVNCPIYKENDLGDGEPNAYYCKNR